MGPITSGVGLAFHQNVAMDSGLQRSIGDCAATIGPFDRDSVLIDSGNRVLAISIVVLLSNNKRRRESAIIHGVALLRREAHAPSCTPQEAPIPPFGRPPCYSTTSTPPQQTMRGT
jgi:hypothetical protein